MEIEFQSLDKVIDRLYFAYYCFLFFIIGMAIAGILIKQEIKQKRNEQLNRIFFGSHAKDEKHG